MSGTAPDQRDPLLRQATRIAAFVFIVLSIVVVVAQVIGRAVFGPSYDVGDVLIPGVFGTLLAILGIGGFVRFVNRDGK